MPVLPVTGMAYRLRARCGHDDVAVLEHTSDLAGAIAVVGRLVETSDGQTVAAAELPVGDLDALAVELRRRELGDIAVGEARCGMCRAAVDITVSLPAYLHHHRPRRYRGAMASPRPGWWDLPRAECSFRLPTGFDVLAAQAEGRGAAGLVARCVSHPSLGLMTAAAHRVVERAMTAVGPVLRAEVEGRCPECEATVTVDFDARTFCLEELRAGAADVLPDVHLLAWAYHWSEASILSLPTVRRRAYATMVAGSLSVPRAAEVLVA